MFIIAATTALAHDNNAIPVFPDLKRSLSPEWKFGVNYEPASLRDYYIHLFSHLNAYEPDPGVEYHFHESEFTYSSIPYHPNMSIEGWFQSEKYFKHRKEEIFELFAPSQSIVSYLEETYSDIINHPKAVSVHLRCYVKENPNLENVYPTYGRKYVQEAMKLFDSDALFVVFSDQIEWAKAQLADFPQNIRFIEGEPYYHDFYLMSLCKHNIICNSTFSWWAAYLNKNADKVVIVPSMWFKPQYNHNSKDLIPDEWTMLE